MSDVATCRPAGRTGDREVRRAVVEVVQPELPVEPEHRQRPRGDAIVHRGDPRLAFRGFARQRNRRDRRVDGVRQQARPGASCRPRRSRTPASAPGSATDPDGAHRVSGAVGKERHPPGDDPAGRVGARVRLVGEPQRVVPDECLDAVVEPRAVIADACHGARVGPLGASFTLVRAMVERQRHLLGVAEPERRAPRLLAAAALVVGHLAGPGSGSRCR